MRILIVIPILILTVAASTLIGPEPYPVVAIGDTGCGCSGQELVAEALIKWHGEKPFKTVLMLGDNIYGRGFRERGGNRSLFNDRFDAYYKPLIDKGVKFHAVLGNHDFETRDGRDMIQDKQRFNILGGDGYYEFSSDMDVNGKPLIRFIGLNSHELKDGDHKQLSWLSKTLTGNEAIWVIPFFHHPIYTPEGGHGDEVEMREHIEDIFLAAGVQVTFAGHNHFYARSRPQRGVVHFVSGGGGRKLNTPEPDDRIAKAVRDYHFVYLEVYPDKIDYYAVSPTKGIFDQGMIERTRMPAGTTDESGFYN